jgi:hypothetical protein
MSRLMKLLRFAPALVCAVVLSHMASAQDFRWALYATGGYMQHQWNPGPFNGFVNSYNDHLSAVMKTPMDEFPATLVGFQRGFGGYYSRDRFMLGFEFFKTKFQTTRESEFLNGRGNAIELNFIDWQFSMDIGRKFGERFSLSALVGTGLRAGVVDVRINHFDGSQSIGNEFYFAGVYRSGFQNDFLLGVQARLQLLPFLDVQARIYRTIPMFETTEGAMLGAFEDSGPGQLIAATYFPADYAVYESNAQNGVYDYEENVIPMSFRGLYINVGVAVKIGGRE